MAEEQCNISKCIVCGNGVANCSKIYSVPTSKDGNTTFSVDSITIQCGHGFVQQVMSHIESLLYSQDIN